MAVTEASRGRLYDRLIEAGMPTRLAGDVSADLGDLTRGIEEIQELFAQVADGRDAEDALDLIESECRDHLIGHIRSIQRTTRQLRKLPIGKREP